MQEDGPLEPRGRAGSLTQGEQGPGGGRDLLLGWKGRSKVGADAGRGSGRQQEVGASHIMLVGHLSACLFSCVFFHSKGNPCFLSPPAPRSYR